MSGLVQHNHQENNSNRISQLTYFYKKNIFKAVNVQKYLNQFKRKNSMSQITTFT